MLVGDVFVDPHSDKAIPLRSAYVQDSSVVPSSGHYQTLLDSALIQNEIKMTNSVKAFTKIIAGKFNLI